MGTPPIIKLVPRHAQNHGNPTNYSLCTNMFSNPLKTMGKNYSFGSNTLDAFDRYIRVSISTTLFVLSVTITLSIASATHSFICSLPPFITLFPHILNTIAVSYSPSLHRSQEVMSLVTLINYSCVRLDNLTVS